MIDYRLGHIEENLKRMDTTLLAFGSATAHLALLDHRSDDNERRIDALEKTVDKIEESMTNIKIALEGVRTKVAIWSAMGSLVGTGVIALLVKYT